MNIGWNCQKHENSPIVLVCTGNVWHFEGLCTNCVPEHTKNHPKNIKIQMESIKEVLDKATEIKKKVSSICQARLQECKVLQSTKQEQYAYMKDISKYRSQVIQQINKVFDQIIDETRKSRQQQQKIQQQNIQKLSKSLQESIDFFKKQQYQNIQEFCRQIKKYYFKDNLQVYVQQFDQVIKQFKEKVINYNPYSWNSQITNKSANFIKQLYKNHEKQQKIDKSAKIGTVVKKQIKKKQPQKKKCGKCGSQMEYLTEWKKHLVCKNCGGKQRNYIRR